MSGRVIKQSGWERRKARVRKKITGTAERPRLNVRRSNKHIYAQIIDDISGTTLAAASTQMKDFDGADAKKVLPGHCQGSRKQGHRQGGFRQVRIYISRQDKGPRGRRSRSRARILGLNTTQIWGFLQTGTNKEAFFGEDRRKRPGA